MFALLSQLIKLTLMNQNYPQHPMTSILISGERYFAKSTKSAIVSIGVPALDPLSKENGDYYCPTIIQYADKGIENKQLVAFGINPLQALELIFAALQIEFGERK